MARNFAAELESARVTTDQLFALLAPDALYERPIPERHRLIFYLGHLEAFDWNLVGRTTLDVPSFHPSFDRLFAFGIDPEPGKQAADTPSDWPSTGEVTEYNRHVRNTIDGLLHNVPDQIAQVAIEHRLMHAETLAYLMHNLEHHHKRMAQALALPSSPPAAGVNWVDIEAGDATLGRSRDRFGWDNEFDEHKVHVPAFRISKYKVTNGDYLNYVRAGGSAPHFWFLSGGEWMYRGMFESVPLPLDWPVYVTHEEAEAYAKWVGAALPTEAQFHRAAYAEGSSELEYPWGNELPRRINPRFRLRAMGSGSRDRDPANK